ncbi:hypothetical protein [Agrobacterium tumefaciens]|uniref:hypothetical protein n=1 Tax=Agrobacterium tumefaciens TaxID=358 RepID=UPI0021D22091|nr:hypothetical protein [Agrobacterium tumefaciens]UXS00798.1 hypothetical protein FY156_04460 [Agrobacterium tumefaciens]
MNGFTHQGVTIERLEEMLLFAAKVVDVKGPIAQPLLDRVEREYLAAIEAKKRGTQSARIRDLIGANRATF